MIIEIMKELSSLGQIYAYVPKNFPEKMISSAPKSLIESVKIAVSLKLANWVKTSYGSYSINPNTNAYLIEVNGNYYFMD